MSRNFEVTSRIVVTCQRGLAPYVERELVDLGLPIVRVFPTGVETSGRLHDCVRLNLRLRCASQVLYSLKSFACDGPDQLYEQLQRIPWENYIAAQGYFSVTGQVSHPTIRTSMFANVKTKDAIVDRLREKTGRRPDSGAELRGTVVFLFWRDEQAEIFLDTTGETLAKHGFRKLPGKAPLVEALAAAIVMASRWDRRSPFINPMCGSGTLAIEAALIATNRYPGLYRERYAFQHIMGYQPSDYQRERESLNSIIDKTVRPTIIATDWDEVVLSAARMNAATAGVSDLIKFGLCEFAETEVPSSDGTGGAVILNPEYGLRLGEESELVETYKRIGDFFKQTCGGYWGYVFTGNLELAKKIGLKTKRRMEFQTAQLECRLLEYELYAGTRKRVVEPSAIEPAVDGNLE